jgi:alcohol dehydrogenase, propanol-preferring
MAKTMRAAVVREFGKPLTIEEVPVPEPRGGAAVAVNARSTDPAA